MDQPVHAQPGPNAVYQVQENPVTSNPEEQRLGREKREQQHHHHHHQPQEHHIPRTQGPTGTIQDATFSSLGRGPETGGDPLPAAEAGTAEQVGRHRELDGEQMRAPGEGDVAAAVRREQKPGAGGSEPDLASDLERKKQEQASMRESIKDQRRHGQLGDGAEVRDRVET